MTHLKQYLIYIGVLLAVLLVGVSCSSDDEDADFVQPVKVVPGKPGQKLTRTLIVYMGGENSLAGFLREDSMEIAKGLSAIGDDARVVVYIDDNKSSRLCVGTKTEPLQVTKVYDRNMGYTDVLDMTTVLTDIITTYPASTYGLVCSSHASGWPSAKTSQTVATQAPRRSYGIDNGSRATTNTGQEMSITDLALVLAKMPHFDYIFFDACFMQCIEVAYELRSVTDYVMASPAEIPGPGAPYHTMLPAMCQVPADLKGMVDDYVDYYETGLAGFPYEGAEMSIIQTDGLKDLAAATAPHVLSLMSHHQTPVRSGIQRYCYLKDYSKYAEFYDMKNWFFQSLPTEDYEAWCEVFDRAVYARLSGQWYSNLPTAIRYLADREHCGGVSAFIPSEQFENKHGLEDYHAMAWYEASGMNQTGW